MLHSGVVVSGTGLQLAPQGVWYRPKHSATKHDFSLRDLVRLSLRPISVQLDHDKNTVNRKIGIACFTATKTRQWKRPIEK